MIQMVARIVLVVSLVLPIGQWTASAEPTEPIDLWQLVPLPLEQSPVQRRPWVLRERDIDVNLQVLQILKDPAARPHPAVVVELFDGNHHEMDITSTVSRINGTTIIRGSFKSPSRGDFTFVATGALLVGSLQLGNRLYKTEHVGNGRLRLLEVDPAKVPPD
jgi:hypothetical protein